ncbi:PTPN12 isoform 3, partial [Pan troglodytes]
VEILRKFIQRVQAMKSPDHNGEDNFARDFMMELCHPGWSAVV